MVRSSRVHGLQKLWLLTTSTSEGLVAQWHVDPPRPGIEPVALHWQADSYSLHHQVSPQFTHLLKKVFMPTTL